MSVSRSLALLVALTVFGGCNSSADVAKSESTDPTVDLQGGLPPLDPSRPGGDDTGVLQDTDVADTDVVDTDVVDTDVVDTDVTDTDVVL